LRFRENPTRLHKSELLSWWRWNKLQKVISVRLLEELWWQYPPISMTPKDKPRRMLEKLLD
jgi:predicted thioredoxin/glutaredoxin